MWALHAGLLSGRKATTATVSRGWLNPWLEVVEVRCELCKPRRVDSAQITHVPAMVCKHAVVVVVAQQRGGEVRMGQLPCWMNANAKRQTQTQTNQRQTQMLNKNTNAKS